MTRYQYETIILEIEAAGIAAGLEPYALTDPNVDAENVLPLTEADEGFYAACARAAYMQAGMMADERGLDINAIMGRVVY